MTNDRKTHWDEVYTAKADDSVSWFEESPAVSMKLIAQAAPQRGAAIDIGGGASRMPEALLELGFADVACLDLSAAALDVAKRRMGDAASRVRWIVADITEWDPDRSYDLWHDRAVFHFLTEPQDQAHYAASIASGLVSGGVAIIGTFAPDGPERCSGLPVARHDAESLAAILGPAFTLLSELRHDHLTPGGSIQKFQFSTFRKL
ncbi:MAG: class I SAM-dependent methyltransferase [Erythrobacter sp.]|nr:MAG: class I SAM-dependent methyltransferase [Erythrobacter sp.]